MAREPLLLPGICLAAGILAAHFHPFHLDQLVWPALAMAVAGILGYFLLRFRKLGFAAICGLCVLGGIATALVHTPGRTPKMDAEDGEAVLVDGCVVNPAVFSPGREQFTLALGRRASIRLSVVRKGDEAMRLDYGQRVEVASKVRRPRNFGNPDAFDYASYLAHQKIYWTGSVASPSDIRLLPGTCGSAPRKALFAVRTWALRRLQSLYPQDQHTLGLLEATLLGETSGAERRWTNEFRITGTYHALVISGLHIWILAASVLFLLRVLQLPRLQALTVAAGASWVYALLAGGNAPVVRAAAGFTLYLAASFLFRRTRMLNLVAAIGIVYLAFAPDQLFDPAFQLSFLSAMAIAGFAIPLNERYLHPIRAAVKRFDQLRYDPKVDARAAQWRVELRLLARTVHLWTGLNWRRAQKLVQLSVLLFVWVAEMALLSACIQFGLALPMISYFHRLSVTGLSANVVIVPLLTLVVPCGFGAILTGFHFLASVTAWLLHAAEACAVWHLQWEPNWRIGAVPLTISILFCAALVLLGIAARHKRVLVPALFAVSLSLFFTICWQPWRPLLALGKLEMDAIDVGQGDSLLVVFPDGKTMLVDAGGIPGMERMARKPNMDLGEDVVSPYLWSRRIKHLDYAVLTHGHSDHMAGMGAVLDNFHPAVLWTGAEPDSKEWEELQQHAAVDHVRIEHLHRGSPGMNIGGTAVRVLSPAPDYTPGDSAKNDDSLVLELVYGKRSVLLTGDAERPSEEDMLASGELKPVTLLKVGHHGSRTSSTEDFLSALNPQFAFISDGYKNQFHHPNDVVLERLSAHKTATYRTDQEGLLTFLTDGDHVQVSSFWKSP